MGICRSAEAAQLDTGGACAGLWAWLADSVQYANGKRLNYKQVWRAYRWSAPAALPDCRQTA